VNRIRVFSYSRHTVYTLSTGVCPQFVCLLVNKVFKGLPTDAEVVRMAAQALE
jgi:hypothetical protein